MNNTATVIELPVKNKIDSFTETCLKEATEVLADIVKNLAGNLLNMDFETLSNNLFEAGKKVTASILKSSIEEHIKNFDDPSSHPCPKCNVLAPGKGCKNRTIATRHGKIDFNRPYYYCKNCQEGFFPVDDELNLAAQVKQHDLGRIALRLFTKIPYKEAADVFKETTGENFSDHCMHGLAEAIGDEATIEKVLPTKEQIESIIEPYTNEHRKPILVVSADGAHEPIRPNTQSRDQKRGSGYWKEAKGFRIYLCENNNIKHIASWHEICDESKLGEALKYAAQLVPKNNVRIALLGDGASWVWRHLREAFPEGREILDYYHVSEYVHKVAGSQYNQCQEKANCWSESVLAKLNFGEVDSVIWGLKRMKEASTEAKEQINRLITYLTNHSEKINYQHNRYGGYPNGSGGIESANKYICHIRLKRSGAWWYETNANRILRLRCAEYNGRLSSIMDFYKVSQKAKSHKKRRKKTTPKE